MYSDRRVFPLLQEMGVAEANCDVRFFLTEARKWAFLRMHIENRPKTRLLCCQIATISVFCIRNRGRWTRSWGQFIDRKQS